MTVNKLYKELGKLIANGDGRKLVEVHKATFHHPLESDGCVIIPLESIGIDTFNIIDDNGGHAENKDGSERLRTSCVLYGGNTDE